MQRIPDRHGDGNVRYVADILSARQQLFFQ
jgi:hypothetical protein